MTTRTCELTLKGLQVTDGEIDVRNLVAILEPLRVTAVTVTLQVDEDPNGRPAGQGVSADDAAEIIGVSVADLPHIDLTHDEIESFLAEIRG